MPKILKIFLTPLNILVFVTLAVALFIRVYRVEALLGFYYDQGRDALVIWRLWHEAKPFLVGPVTGLVGIFLGPFYYYLIAPLYLIGGGNPIYPAGFLSFLATLAILFLYKLGAKMHSRTAGFFAVLISGFSYYLVMSGRWLANPTPILLTSVILLYSMWEIVNRGRKFWWIVISLMIAVSLQFESASAIFYLPMILVFAFWQRKNLPGRKYSFWALLIFFASLIPQFLFNIRHENILVKNFYRVLVEEKSFRADFWEVLPKRINYFWTVFSSKIFPERNIISGIFLFLAGLSITSVSGRLKKVISLFAIFLGAPIVGITFFQGNFGNIFDYYLTGYYFPFILLFSIGLAEILKLKFGKLIILVFFILFFQRNLPMLKNYLTTAGVPESQRITLSTELSAVNWIFDDARGRGEFNIDVYVPPVIPYSYDYLFLWQGSLRQGNGLVKDRQVPLLYTLHEIDLNDWGKHFAWIERQKEIGKIESSMQFGGIVVERRIRIK